MTTTGPASVWLAAMNLTEAKVISVTVWCHKNGPATKTTAYQIYPPGPQSAQVQSLPDEIQIIDIVHYDAHIDDTNWIYHTYLNGWDEYWIPEDFLGTPGLKKLGQLLPDELFAQVWETVGYVGGKVPA